MKATTKVEPQRHPDLFTTEEAAAYIGVSRLDKLPDEYRPEPMSYNERLYHRRVLDDVIDRASKASTGKGRLKLA